MSHFYPNLLSDLSSAAIVTLALALGLKETILSLSLAVQ